MLSERIPRRLDAGNLQYNWKFLPFRDIFFSRKRRAFCQDILGLIRARSGGKNCPARRNRKREDSADFTKEIPPLQMLMPRRAGKKRQSQKVLDPAQSGSQGGRSYS
jgi:hypothetical protein